MTAPAGDAIVLAKHPLQRAIHASQALIALGGLVPMLAIFLGMSQAMSQLRAGMNAVSSGSTLVDLMVSPLIVGAVIGVALMLPAFIVAITITKLVARRDLRIAMLAETDPAILALLRSFELQRRKTWFYVPIRMFASVDAGTLLGELASRRPIVAAIGLTLPPPMSQAPGEVFNLIEQRQNPPKSKALWLMALAGVVIIAMTIYQLISLSGLSARAGGPGLPTGTITITLLSGLLPGVIIGASLLLPKLLRLRWALLTPGKLEDSRPLRGVLAFFRRTPSRGLLNFTPDDSILVITAWSPRRRVGTFVRRDGARAAFQLIADDKLDPLAEVLARWK